MTENLTIRASPPQAVAEHGSCVLLARRPLFVKCAVNSISGKNSQLSVACGAGAGRERLEETVISLQLQSKGRLNQGSANLLSFPQPSLQSVHPVGGAFAASTVHTCKFYLQPVSGRQHLPAKDQKNHGS